MFKNISIHGPIAVMEARVQTTCPNSLRENGTAANRTWP